MFLFSPWLIVWYITFHLKGISIISLSDRTQDPIICTLVIHKPSLFFQAIGLGRMAWRNGLAWKISCGKSTIELRLLGGFGPSRNERGNSLRDMICLSSYAIIISLCSATCFSNPWLPRLSSGVFTSQFFTTFFDLVGAISKMKQSKILLDVWAAWWLSCFSLYPSSALSWTLFKIFLNRLLQGSGNHARRASSLSVSLDRLSSSAFIKKQSIFGQKNKAFILLFLTNPLYLQNWSHQRSAISQTSLTLLDSDSSVLVHR